MCGICGFTWNDKSLVKRMMARISHRGPDGRGIFEDKGITLGHQRLAVIDLSEKGKQPMPNKNTTCWITFNGEIYNYQRLRSKLEGLGRTFSSESDTETILAAYDEYGEDCVQHLDGQFAFALWDGKNKKLFAARDRLGKKPFYYTIVDGGLVFASEVKALLEHESLKDVMVDAVALDQYFTYRYTPGEDTLFKGIKKLRPGHTLTFCKGMYSTRQYWQLVYKPNADSVEENAKRALTLLESAVKDRMVSDVPLGAYLSGGLDSSAIVALMAKASRDGSDKSSNGGSESIKTFSVSFPYEKEDESRYARLVAEEFDTDHHELHVKQDAVKVLPKVIWHLDEPLADASCIPTYLMSELTKKHVTVILSGEGSDELFAGYAKYKIARLSRFLRYLPNPVARLGRNSASLPVRRAAMIAEEAASDEEAYDIMSSVFSARDKESDYAPEFVKQVKLSMRKKPWQHLTPSYPKGDVLAMMLANDLVTWLPDDLLLKGDKMTLAHAVEGRMPFLDHHLVELAATIPSSQKLHGMTDKYVYRKAIRGILPKEIVARKKHGFTVPVDSWLQGELRETAAQLLEDNEILSYFKKPALETALARHADHPYYRRQLWTVLNFAMWHKIFVQKTTLAKMK